MRKSSLTKIGASAFGSALLLCVAALASPVAAQEVAAVAESAAAEEEWPELSWAASTENFIQTQFSNASERFAADWAGLPQVPVPAGDTLRRGSAGARVAALRIRLGLPAGDQFDAQLADRIAAYRSAHGLPSGKQADAQLVQSLNRGYGYYRDIIDRNVFRAAALPSDLGERFVLVDITAQRLHMYEAENISGSMNVVVGSADLQTPPLSSKIDRVVLRPYWNVPPDLTQMRYADRVLRGGKRYLDTRGFQALSDWTENPRVLSYEEVDWLAVKRGDVMLRLRQEPGPGNGMGDIKFMFPNATGVYLHDTPSKNLFAKTDRFFSAGCIRVERPWELARWLFGHTPTAAGTAPEQSVALPDAVGVHVVYFTALPTETGFDFREDTYRFDQT